MEGSDLEGLIEEWEGIGVVVRHDPPSGAWIFVALHDDTLGRPVGGCRMKRYESPAEGLLDAMRLARGMTYKWATIECSFGGGKSVLAVPRPLSGEERRGLLRRFGQLLESLRGTYATGEDLGTTPEDMRVIAGETRWVMGVASDDDEPEDPGPYTALGVLAGIEAAAGHVWGGDGLEGRSVLIQGVGDVGGPLARLLAEEGAELLVSDLDEGRAAAVAREVGGRTVDGEAVYDTECDIFAPCAVGAVLHPATISRLRCRVVAGSANNQLRSEEDARRLHDRDILYVPDYVINAGGALAFALMHEGLTDRDRLEARILALGGVVAEILEDARRRDELPHDGARRRAEAALGRASEP